jgi:anti-sigma factor RsiW
MQPSNKNLQCDPRRLRDYLDQQMSAAQESELETHLNECPTCRQQLNDWAVEPRRFFPSVSSSVHSRFPTSGQPLPGRSATTNWAERLTCRQRTNGSRAEQPVVTPSG